MQLPHDAKYIWKQFKRELRIKLPELQSITYVYVYVKAICSISVLVRFIHLISYPREREGSLKMGLLIHIKSEC